MKITPEAAWVDGYTFGLMSALVGMVIAMLLSALVGMVIAIIIEHLWPAGKP